MDTFNMQNSFHKIVLKCLTVWLVAGWITVSGTLGSQAAAPLLKVSENHRFLVYADGRPFFWQADTAWEMATRLNKADVDLYLTRRHEQGFTVIFTVAFSLSDGPGATNAYGYLPFENLDPTKPAVKEGPDSDYWDHMDAIVAKAESMGMYIGLLPSWGDAWSQGGGVFPFNPAPTLLNPTNAGVYGKWLGNRYKDRAVIWIIGGDRGVDNETHKTIIRNMAEGLRAGDGGAHLITFHSIRGSSEWFHDEPWLDFNMWQTGHHLNYLGNYDKIPTDYQRQPTKPVVDGESIYEGPPISFNAPQNGHALAADVRRPIYWELFEGAFGFTYGNHATWQMYTTNRAPINLPLQQWKEALDDPGANQMQYAKELMLSRPFLTRIPDNSIIVDDRVPTAVPGGGRFRFVGTRDEAGTYAMVYVPAGQKFQVRMDKIKGDKVKAWWFDPRTGKASQIGIFPNQGVREFVPVNLGELLDYVLVLDDAALNYPAPGGSSLVNSK